MVPRDRIELSTHVNFLGPSIRRGSAWSHLKSICMTCLKQISQPSVSVFATPIPRYPRAKWYPVSASGLRRTPRRTAHLSRIRIVSKFLMASSIMETIL